jgi:hypothetical protein
VARKAAPAAVVASTARGRVAGGRCVAACPTAKPTAWEGLRAERKEGGGRELGQLEKKGERRKEVFF